MSRKIVIEPVTRVEGHGKVTIHLNDEGEVEQSRLHIVEFRGFERFVQGRPYWEAPVLVQRLCGICPVSHHLAAAKAMDVIVGAGTGDGLTPTAEKMRRLMHYGQIFQSHSLHFFHLASPDLLFGYDSPPETRNVIGVIMANRELATQAVLMRKYGQEIIAATAGKKIHGTGAVPGGINKNLSIEERDALLKGPAPDERGRDGAVRAGRAGVLQGLLLETQGFHRQLLAISPRITSPSCARTAPWTSTTASCAPWTRTDGRSCTTWNARTTSRTSARRCVPGPT